MEILRPLLPLDSVPEMYRLRLVRLEVVTIITGHPAEVTVKAAEGIQVGQRQATKKLTTIRRQKTPAAGRKVLHTLPVYVHF